MPFSVKKKVFEAALLSAILYGCESWLSHGAVGIAAPMYMACIKQLLGVRKTTASDLCLIEAGLPTISQRVKTAQQSVWKMWEARQQMADDPFAHAMRLAMQNRTTCARYITNIKNYDADAERDRLHSSVIASREDQVHHLPYDHQPGPHSS